MADIASGRRIVNKISSPRNLEGAFGFNAHGSLPVDQADLNIEPNFRHFDFYLSNTQPPDADLASRVYKYDKSEIFRTEPLDNYLCRSCPTVVASLPFATASSFLYAYARCKGLKILRLNFIAFFATYFLLFNWECWFGRELAFDRDFSRNQMYVNDEIRYQRDKQRVREALYAKQFVKNPVAEYRIKSWQIADRFA